MKTKTFSLAILIFLLTIIEVSCRDEIKPEPELLVLKSFLLVRAVPESVAYNETTMIIWSFENVVNGSCYLNDKPVSKDGNIVSDPLIEKTTFHLKAIGLDKKLIDTTIIVKVGHPPVVVPTRIDSLCNMYYFMLSTDSRSFSEGRWSYTVWNKDQLAYKTTYNVNGTCCTVNTLTGVEVANGKWFFHGVDSLNTCKYHFTDTSLVLIESSKIDTVITVLKSYPLK